MMDNTLIIVSLEPMRMVTKLKRKSLRPLEKSGHHNVPGRNQEVSGVVHSVRLCVICEESQRERESSSEKTAPALAGDAAQIEDPGLPGADSGQDAH